MDLKMHHVCLELSRKRNLFADRVVAKKGKRKKQQEGVAGCLSALVHPSVPPLGGLRSLWPENSTEFGLKALRCVSANDFVRNRCILRHFPATVAHSALTLCTLLRALPCDSVELAPIKNLIYIWREP